MPVRGLPRFRRATDLTGEVALALAGGKATRGDDNNYCDDDPPPGDHGSDTHTSGQHDFDMPCLSWSRMTGHGIWASQTIYLLRRQELIDRGQTPGLNSAERIELTAAKQRIGELEAGLAIHRRALGLPAERGDPTGRSRLVPSMGSVGSSADAMIESFSSRMQVELLDRRNWRTRVELANAIFEYLEVFHNRQRRHSALSSQRV